MNLCDSSPLEKPGSVVYFHHDSVIVRFFQKNCSNYFKAVLLPPRSCIVLYCIVKMSLVVKGPC